MPSRTVRQSPPPSLGRNRTRPVVHSRQRSTQGQRRTKPTSCAPPAVPFLPVSLGGYPFAETSTRWEILPHGAGIFALLHRPADPSQSYQPVFLDEADDVYEALAELSTRVLLSAAEEQGTIVYAVLYTELVTAARRQIVTGLRTELHLPTTPPFLAPARHRLSPVLWRQGRNAHHERVKKTVGTGNNALGKKERRARNKK